MSVSQTIDKPNKHSFSLSDYIIRNINLRKWDGHSVGDIQLESTLTGRIETSAIVSSDRKTFAVCILTPEEVTLRDVEDFGINLGFYKKLNWD